MESHIKHSLVVTAIPLFRYSAFYKLPTFIVQRQPKPHTFTKPPPQSTACGRRRILMGRVIDATFTQ